MDIRKIASRVAEGWQDKLHGGLADDNIPENFNPIQLVNGLVVELEHVNKEAHEMLKNAPDDIHKALEIAMDHLTEDAEYYTKLAKMEGEEFVG
jgi:hypothetical protein